MSGKLTLEDCQKMAEQRVENVCRKSIKMPKQICCGAVNIIISGQQNLKI